MKIKYLSDVKTGLKWSSLFSVISTFLVFIQNIILARILTPEDFGLMAILLIVVGVIDPLLSIGLNNAVIQADKTSSSQLSTVFWTNIFLGTFFTFGVYFSGHYIQLIFNRTDLDNYIQLISIIFIISALGSLHYSILRKQLKFIAQNSIEIASLVLSFSVAVIMAWRGYGVSSIICGYIVQCSTRSILSLFYGFQYFKPQFDFEFKNIHSLLKFGAFTTGTSLVNAFNANIDKYLINFFLGPYYLGLYSLVYNIVILPLRKLNPIVNNIAFPIYSKLNTELKEVNKYYSGSIIALTTISLPFFIIIFLNAEKLITVFYGEQWIPAASTFSILCIVGFLKITSNPGGSLFLAFDRPWIPFYWNIFWTFYLAGILIFFYFCMSSFESFAYGYAVAAITSVVMWHYLIIKSLEINYDYIFSKAKLILYYIIACIVIKLLIDQFLFSEFLTMLLLNILLGALYIYFIKKFMYRELKKLLNEIA